MRSYPASDKSWTPLSLNPCHTNGCLKSLLKWNEYSLEESVLCMMIVYRVNFVSVVVWEEAFLLLISSRRLGLDAVLYVWEWVCLTIYLGLSVLYDHFVISKRGCQGVRSVSVCTLVSSCLWELCVTCACVALGLGVCHDFVGTHVPWLFGSSRAVGPV